MEEMRHGQPYHARRPSDGRCISGTWLAEGIVISKKPTLKGNLALFVTVAVAEGHFAKDCPTPHRRAY